MKEIENNKDTRVDRLLKISESRIDGTTFVTEDGIEVKIKMSLSFEEFQSFVISMMEWCADFDSNPFAVSMRDVAFRYHTITYYTDIELSGLTTEEYWDILYHTSLFSDVITRINSEQYRVLLKTIEEQFDFEKQKEININSLRANQLINSVKELTGNVEPEKVSEMLETLNKSGITTEQIIGNVVENLKKEK